MCLQLTTCRFECVSLGRRGTVHKRNVPYVHRKISTSEGVLCWLNHDFTTHTDPSVLVPGYCRLPTANCPLPR
jgi:hypothetical protein